MLHVDKVRVMVWRRSSTGEYHFSSSSHKDYPYCNARHDNGGVKILHGVLERYPYGKDACSKCIKFFNERWNGYRR